MQRAGLLAFMLLISSAALLQAQRAGGGFGGSGAQISVGRMPGGHGIGANGFFPQRSVLGLRTHRDRGFGAFWLPWYYPEWDDDYLWNLPSYRQPVNTPSPQVIVLENRDPRPTAQPVEPPKLVELAPSKEAPSTRPQPPALFLLKNGERLESRYYLLTTQSLQIDVGSERRTIPVSVLDLDATVAANHQRGIEVTVPRDRATVLLVF